MNKKTERAFGDFGMEITRGEDMGCLRCGPLMLSNNGRTIRGHVLEVRWALAGGKYDSAFFFLDESGKGTLSPSGGIDRLWRIDQAMDKKPYSEADPIIDAWRIASALAGVGTNGWADAAAEILPVAERFVESRFDPEYLNLPVGRKLTASEYAFVVGKPERAVGITAFPFLLPYLVSGLAKPDPSSAAKIVESIDAGSWSLIEAVSAEFGTDVESVRAMHSLPAWLPTCYAHAVGAAETAPDCYARAIFRLEPSERPGEGEWDEFGKLIAWLELTMWDSFDFPDRRAIPEAAAAIWRRRKGAGPMTLPHRIDLEWKGRFARLADQLYRGKGMGYEGTLQGKPKVLAAGAWTLLTLLVTTDPIDLRYPYSDDPGSVRDVFEYATELFDLKAFLPLNGERK